MTVRRGAVWLVVVTLLGSGGYVFVYLYRWEWHRAITAGVFFLAAQAALVLFVLLGRLSDLAARLDRMERGLRTLRAGDRAAPAVDAARSHLEDARPAPHDPFAWLRPDQGGPGVFVPVLLGAGVVISGVAWCVERIARLTAGPALERRLARQLAPLLVEAGELVPPRGSTGDAATR